MRVIPLSKGYEAIVDDIAFDLVNQYKWYYNDGYAITYHKGKRLRMHRFILGTPDGFKTDHINHIKLDNRRENLRVCTRQENNRNITMRRDNTSGYIGVNLDKTTGHWKPVVYVDGKPKTFGQFKNKHHAALARDLWATDFYGEFASTNFSVVSTG